MSEKITLDKWTQMHYFEIFEPKYSTKQVLLKASRVGTHNKIVFTKAKSMGTMPYYVSGKVVKKCPKVSNGSIWCYSVPLDDLRLLELSENSILEIL